MNIFGFRVTAARQLLSLGLVAVFAAPLLSGAANAALLNPGPRIFPDTAVFGLDVDYNQFTQQLTVTSNANTLGNYTEFLDPDHVVDEIEFEINAQVDNLGNMIGVGSFEFRGAIDDLGIPFSTLLSGTINNFGSFIFSYGDGGGLALLDFTGDVLSSAPGTTYDGGIGKFGIILTDNRVLANNSSSGGQIDGFNNSFSTDFTQGGAFVDVFLIPVPPSAALFLVGLAFLVLRPGGRSGQLMLVKRDLTVV